MASAGGRKGKRDAAAAAALAFKKRLKGPEEILAKVRKLSARVKAEPELMRTISDLGLADECREVVDKDSNAVLDEIEAVVFEIAVSVLEGEGYAFQMPSRSKANQMYVPELDRIVLKSATQKRPFASVQTVKKTTITTRCTPCSTTPRPPKADRQSRAGACARGAVTSRALASEGCPWLTGGDIVRVSSGSCSWCTSST